MRSTGFFGLLFASWLVAVPAIAQDDRDAAIARENEQREAMQNGMIAVVDAVNMGSFGLLVGAIDAEAMQERIFGLRLIDQQVKKQFRKGFEDTFPRMIEQSITQGQQTPVKAHLLGFRSRGNQGLAVVRYDLDNFQFAYHEYELTLDQKDSLVIVDWTDFFWGERFSQGVGESLVIAAPSDSAVRKLVDFQNLSANQVFKLSEALKAMRDFQVARYFEIVESMDDELKRQRVVVLGGVQMTKKARARRQLRTALIALDRYLANDPLYTNLLLDYYFPTRRYEDARASLQRLAARLAVEDAAMEARLSSAELVMRNTDAAVQHAERSVELESDLELGWWSVLRARNAAQDFAGAVEALATLEDDFGYDLNPEALGKDKALARLLQSNEYKEWRASRSSASTG